MRSACMVPSEARTVTSYTLSPFAEPGISWSGAVLAVLKERTPAPLSWNLAASAPISVRLTLRPSGSVAAYVTSVAVVAGVSSPLQ